MKTPVIFAIFNRPDLAELSFARIRQARPRQLLVVADGPRADRPGEEALCEAARAVTEKIDWPCEVQRDYSAVNLGSGRRVSTGITRGFETFDDAIILEDDCVADPSFFPYCEQMLAHYRDDERVMHITGDNFQGGIRRGPASYYFSKYPHVWGWATWKRAWRHFDFELVDWKKPHGSGLVQNLGDAREKAFWSAIFERTAAGVDVSWWDYQWVFACWKNSGLSVTPQVNLVHNVGFRPDGTHSFPESNARLIVSPQAMETIRHPAQVCRDPVADQYTFDTIYSPVQASPKPVASRLFRQTVGKWLRAFGLR